MFFKIEIFLLFSSSSSLSCTDFNPDWDLFFFVLLFLALVTMGANSSMLRLDLVKFIKVLLRDDNAGVLVPGTQRAFISAAHTDEIVDELISVFLASFDAVAAEDLY